MIVIQRRIKTQIQTQSLSLSQIQIQTVTVQILILMIQKMEKGNPEAGRRKGKRSREVKLGQRRTKMERERRRVNSIT